MGVVITVIVILMSFMLVCMNATGVVLVMAMSMITLPRMIFMLLPAAAFFYALARMQDSVTVNIMHEVVLLKDFLMLARSYIFFNI